MITAYRNRRPQALKAIRRKAKYNRKPWAQRQGTDDEQLFIFDPSLPPSEDLAILW